MVVDIVSPTGIGPPSPDVNDGDKVVGKDEVRVAVDISLLSDLGPPSSKVVNDDVGKTGVVVDSFGNPPIVVMSVVVDVALSSDC